MRKVMIALAGAALILGAAGAGAQMTDGYRFLKAVGERDGNIVTEMLGKPNSAVVNAQNGDGEGALHIVTRQRNLPYLQFLTAKGLRTDLKDRQGRTPLGVAAELGWLEGARVLLGARAPVDAADRSGATPLIIAVRTRNADMARLLLAAGADPDLGDRATGLSARDHAKADRRAAAVLRVIETTTRPATRKVAGPKL